MREILFKAKRIDNGEWFEGVPVDVTPLTCFAEEVKKEAVMIRAGFADWGMPRGMEYTKVDPETVCQHTGLADKNGVKIFEGDRCVFVSDNDLKKIEYEVCWDSMDCRFIAKESEAVLGDSLDVFFANHCVVVGNIYDKEE